MPAYIHDGPAKLEIRSAEVFRKAFSGRWTQAACTDESRLDVPGSARDALLRVPRVADSLGDNKISPFHGIRSTPATFVCKSLGPTAPIRGRTPSVARSISMIFGARNETLYHSQPECRSSLCGGLLFR